MIPRDTVYRVAASPADYKACRALQGAPADRLTFPTIMAERGGRLIGFLGTQPRRDMILAGPLVIEGGSVFTVIRLVEVYDAIMRKAGVSRYVVGSRAERPIVAQLARRLGVAPWLVEGETTYFQREVA
jgi:hypothetical protein